MQQSFYFIIFSGSLLHSKVHHYHDVKSFIFVFHPMNKHKLHLSADKLNAPSKICLGKQRNVDTGLRFLLLFEQIDGLEKGRLFYKMSLNISLLLCGFLGSGLLGSLLGSRLLSSRLLGCWLLGSFLGSGLLGSLLCWLLGLLGSRLLCLWLLDLLFLLLSSSKLV